MSDILKDGGPAFPRSSHGPADDLDMWEGMTLRDYFAAQALAGWIASFTETAPSVDRAARVAYQYADAMLERRKETADL